MPGWMVTIVCLWIGLNPALRLWIYPVLSLKEFITALDFISVALIVFQVFSLWALYGFPRKSRPWRWRSFADAVLLFPLFWMSISVLLFLVIDFGLMRDAAFGPLYDSQLYTQSHPLSWTTLGFFVSAIIEEIFFRAWLPDRLQQKLRKSSAIGISAVLFALAHVSLHFSPLVFTLHLLFALALSYVRTRHGLGAAIGIHLLNNVMAFSNEFWRFNLWHYAAEHSWVGQLLVLVGGGGVLLVLLDLRNLVDRGTRGV